MKVMIIGGGGREHALAWKISQSGLVEKIYCAPGNGGTSIEEKCTNINLTSIEHLLEFAIKENINLTVVGPEGPLVEGIVDAFKDKGLNIFGPSKTSAMLEGSKAFAKEFMKKYNVKTATYESFIDAEKAINYAKECNYPMVIKADGLAAGKGVVICEDFKAAKEAIEKLMVEDIFKGSGKKIIIEEFIEGVEASILAITDGETILPFVSAKDHKAILDGDKGANTGGMGAIAPNPYCSEKVLENFRRKIMYPTLEGIKKEKMDYKGIIFFGIMIKDEETYLLEYNVRFGDPETQAVLPLMKNDIVELINCSLNTKLQKYTLEWKEGFSCNVVAASGGYPGNFKHGYRISGVKNCNDMIFLAGTKEKSGELSTSGGRVLSVTALGKNLCEAREKAYKSIENIRFKDMYYRKDIGAIRY